MAEDQKNTAPAAETTKSQAAASQASRVDRTFSSSRVPADTDAAGKTTIADGVVAKVAGIAAREVAGVYALGGGGARAFGAIRDAINATDLSQGVKVEVGETQAAADLSIVVDYPLSVQKVADDVRQAVADAITQLVGLEVVEINIEVSDIFIAGQDDDDKGDKADAQRVQ